MIITNATIAMAAEHHHAEKREVSERLDFWLGAAPGQNEGDANNPRATPQWNERGYDLSSCLCTKWRWRNQ